MIDSVFGRGASLMFATFYLAMLFSIVPLGDWLGYARPSWFLLIALFWAQEFPSRFGIKSAFVMGLCADVLFDQVLGLHAVVLVSLVYLQLLLNNRFRVMSTFQQVTRIVLFSFMYLLSILVLESFFASTAEKGVLYWLPVFVNALLWPWLHMILDGLKSRFQLYESNS